MMKRAHLIAAILLSLALALPAFSASGSSALAGIEATHAHIKQTVMGNTEAVTAAQASASPVRQLLDMCWETVQAFQQAEPDKEKFISDNTFYMTMLFQSEELREVMAKVEAERAAAREQEILAQQAEEAAEEAYTKALENLDLDYERADLMQKAGLFDEAAAVFLELGEFRDAPLRARECLVMRHSAQYVEADQLFQEEKFLDSYQLFSSLGGYMDADARALGALHAFISETGKDAELAMSRSMVSYASRNKLISHMNEMKEISDETRSLYYDTLFRIASAALTNGVYDDALSLFGFLKGENWPGAAERHQEASRLSRRVIAVTGGAYPFHILWDGTVAGPASQVFPGSAAWRDVQDAGSNLFYAAALHKDGTVSIAPNPFFYQGGNKFSLPLPEVSKWKNITRLAVGASHIIAIDRGNRVHADGSNSYGQIDFPATFKAQGAAAGQYHSLLLKNQHLAAYGNQLFKQLAINERLTITGSAAGAFHSLALQPDGKVKAAGLNADGQCEVSSWADVIQVAAGSYHSVALKNDGTVMAVGLNANGQCEVDGWTDVSAIAAGPSYTIGLKADGTVVSTVKDGLYLPYATSRLFKMNPTEWESLTQEASRNMYGLDTAHVSDRVQFGRYEQDNDKANGPEPITWIVLSKDDEEVLLLSEVCLDARPYHSKAVSITWAESALRAWLNDEFLNAAFDPEEQEILVTSSLENKDNERYKTKGGAATQDRVFLLSLEEYERYLTNNEARRAKVTEVSRKTSVYVRDSYTNWWLRSPGPSNKYAASVSYNGILQQSLVVVTVRYGVRPVIRVSLVQ